MSAAPARSSVFDRGAERYDRARPRYPRRLVDELVAALPGSDVLEIGCGTGQLSVALAGRGPRVTALELGPALAARAASHLASYDGCRVINADFEQWRPDRRYDAVVSATAFGWLGDGRIGRVADALEPGGLAAIVGTSHVRGGTEAFFIDVQACYERWDPSTEPGLRLASKHESDGYGFAEDERFEIVAKSHYFRDIAYTASDYVDLLGTYSGMIELSETRRERLFADIQKLIEERYDGRIVKRYQHELLLTRRA